jgi:limonene 1,2-monooxygenase
MEERAATFGHDRGPRAKWRLVGLMHVAETREQAYKDVEHGIEQWFRYFRRSPRSRRWRWRAATSRR